MGSSVEEVNVRSATTGSASGNGTMHGTGDQLVAAYLGIRDAYAATRQNVGEPRGLKHSDFVTFAVENRNVHASVKQMFYTLIGPDYTSYSDSELRNVAFKGPARQMYLMARVVDIKDGDVDRRVRDFWELYRGSEVHKGIPRNVLLGVFFKSRVLGVINNSSPFHTKPCTDFEFVIALSMVQNISLHKKASGRKRNFGMSSTKFSNVSLSDKLQCQRVGYGVQLVTRAWDCFAQFLGFPNVEVMMLPYIRLDYRNMVFKDIGERSLGFQHKDCSKQFVKQKNVTTIRDNVVEWAWSLPGAVDTGLRLCAKEYLGDISSVVVQEKLFEISAPSKWEALKRFNITNTRHFPTRFEDFSESLVTTVQDAIKPLKLTESHGSHYTVHQAVKQEPGEDDDIMMVPVRTNPVAERHKGIHEKDGIADNEVEEVVESVAAPRATTGLQTTTLSQKLTYSVKETGIQPPPYPKTLDQLMAYEYCERQMSRRFRLHNCSFHDLVEVDDNKSGDSELSIEGRVQFVLSDPPYGTRAERNRENSGHDVLTEKSMNRAGKRISKLLRPGGHVILFCSWDQIQKWREVLRSVTYTDDSGTTRFSFVVDEQPLQFVRSMGNSMGNPGRRSCRLYQTSEYAVHAVRSGVPYSQQHRMVNYENFNFIPSRYPAYHAIIDQVPPMSYGETLLWNVRNSEGITTRKKVRPEQKCRALLKELICRFSQPGDLVVDLFAGTFSTAMACMELPKHRIFVGCEDEKACFEHAKHAAIVRFASIIREGNTSLEKNQELRKMAHTVVIAFPMGRLRHTLSWKAVNGFSPYQMLPPHVVQFLSTLWRSEEIAKLGKSKTFDQWPSVLQGRMNLENMNSLLAMEAVHYGLRINKSTIRHDNAGVGVFATRRIAVGEVVCYFYGTLVYHDLTNRKEVHKTYGDGVMGVTKDRFRKYAVEVDVHGHQFSALPHRRTLSHGKQTNPILWVVPAPFCIAGYINDPKYVEGDKDLDAVEDGLGKKREANVRMKRTPGLGLNRRKLTDYRLIKLEALVEIEEGDEIFSEYGNVYDWHTQTQLRIDHGAIVID